MNTPTHTTLLDRQQGFTLVELLVAMVVMGVLVLALASIFRTQMASSVANQDETEQQVNVQAVAGMISNDIAMAGFGNVSSTPIAHVNAGGAGESDTLTIQTAAMRGSAIQTFVIVAGGNEVTVRCWGWEGKGDVVDPVRDAYATSDRPLYLWFIDPKNGEPVQSMANPTRVTSDGAADFKAGDDCDGSNDTTLPDINNDGTTDSFITLTVADEVAGLARGTTVYGIRAAPSSGTPVFNTQVTWDVDMVNKVLTRNGTPVLLGVEDFQVRYRTFDGGATWHDDLMGVDTRTIDQVQYALVVRHQRPNPHNQRDPREQIETFDHTINLSAEDRRYARKQYVFTVRPRNNAL